LPLHSIDFMAIELKVPALGESVTEVEIGDWLKKPGEMVQRDEPVVVLESEKASMELPAPASGKISQVLKKRGDTAVVGEVIAYLEAGGDGERPQQPAPKAAELRVMPAAERALAEQGLKPEQVRPSGPGGRLLKEDVLRHVAAQKAPAAPAQKPPEPKSQVAPPAENRREEVVRMSRLRRTIAQRLVEAQQNAALLTTFNEVDMSAVMTLRKEFGEAFLEKYQTKLGFMSFFVKACVDALKAHPEVNAEIRGEDMVFHNYYDIGIAVGTDRGLVVPVLRNAEQKSFAEIEVAIGDFAKRARDNKLNPDELQGGTFTISNGGVYGSLLSTPIVNPPQSGILGLHAIQERPVAREGNVVIRPMMYIALSYDHRIVDGRGAVGFLRRIKDAIESPARMLIEV
jgi:2-oxoglutarate dehydrogenase E2 component (dihydrolipoamide succinyltransferase)